MKRLSIVLFSLLVLGCGDASTGPPLETQPEFGKEQVTAPANAQGADAVIEAVTGSGQLTLSAGDWRTFSIHATKSAAGRVQGTFQWRVHLGRTGSKVKGDVICFSVEGNQAWIAVLFEKAQNPDNVGKWASIWVVDNGEGVGAQPDEVGLHWRNFPFDPDNYPENPDPEAFCQEHWTDMSLFPVEAGNIQIH